MPQPPCWNDPIGSACAEAEVAIRRGLLIPPTLYGFEDGEPTLRVRPSWSTVHRRPQQAVPALVALVPALGIRQLMVFSHAQITDPTIADDHLREALATYGISVEVAERRGDEVSSHAAAVDVSRDGDEVAWTEAESAEDGTWTGLMRQALTLGPAHDGLTPMGLAYALSRWGVVVEVAPGWRERYGFATPPPRLERLVRRVDRRRARDVARAARSASAPASRSAVR